MSNGFILILYGCMLLCVGGGHDTFAIWYISHSTNLQEFFGHVEIELFASDTVQLDQCQFQFLMSWRLPHGLAAVVFWVACKENLVDVLSTFFGNIQQLFVSSCLIIGNGCFVQMSNVIKFVTVDNERVGRVAHHVLFFANPSRVRWIKVTISLLCSADEIG